MRPVAFGISAFVLTIASCGRLLAVDPDAGATNDASLSRCTGSFAAPVALPAFNSTGNDRDLRFTPNELFAVLASDRNADGFHVYASSRSSTDAQFDAPIESSRLIVTTVTALYPSIANSKTVFYEAYCTTGYQNNFSGLCVAVRDAGNGTFAHEEPVPFIGQNDNPGPFGGGGFAQGDGYVADGPSAYYYVNPLPPDSGAPYAIFSDEISGEDAEYAFVNPKAEFTPDDPTMIVDNPIVTNDDLTLYVSITSATNQTPHVARATRTSVADAFTGLTPVHELDSDGGEYATWISVDECRVYLTRKVGGDSHIFVASRSE
jgi:hypothetical protein